MQDQTKQVKLSDIRGTTYIGPEEPDKHTAVEILQLWVTTLTNGAALLQDKLALLRVLQIRDSN